MNVRSLILLLLVPLAWAVSAQEHKCYCKDPTVDRQWEEALDKYPQDKVVVRLAAKRETLCDMIEMGEIGVDKARLLSEKALTKTLLERAREEQAKRGLMQLFVSF